MKQRFLIKRFKLVETTSKCARCTKPFTYFRSCRPQIRCRPCQRKFHLERMRIKNAEYRKAEKTRLEQARA